MKNLEFKIPEGYELDKENSTDETIIYKKKENKYPLSVEKIKGRNFYISEDGRVLQCDEYIDKNNLSSKERSEAFLALMQLVELRDAWNEIDGFEADWTSRTQSKHCIENCKNKICSDLYCYTRKSLHFGSEKTRNLFLDTFRDLIETAKELL